MHPPPSERWDENTIMTECTQENGHRPVHVLSSLWFQQPIHVHDFHTYMLYILVQVEMYMCGGGIQGKHYVANVGLMGEIHLKWIHKSKNGPVGSYMDVFTLYMIYTNLSQTVYVSPSLSIHLLCTMYLGISTIHAPT